MDRSLGEVDVDPTTLTGILVSHEHSDHIKGLGIIARKYNLPIYANEKTWKAMENAIGKISLDQKFYFETETVKTFGDMERSEEHTSELQSRGHLVCRLLLEKQTPQ